MNFAVFPVARVVAAALAMAALGACASKPLGYGVGEQVERQQAIQAASNRDPAPDTPAMYLNLIGKMQAQGLYFASLAHIDAYDRQYGATPETTLLRADALRMTNQPAASADAYRRLDKTPLAMRAHRGLGLLAGASGDFAQAANELQLASQLAPTDAMTLSDLGYARLRAGDIDGARVPLMQAAQLDATNPKIVSNVAIYLLASGQMCEAQSLMEQQKLSLDTRTAIRNDAGRALAAARGGVASTNPDNAPRANTLAPTITSAQTSPMMAAPRVLQRFAQ